MAFTENLSEFFDTDDFAISAIWIKDGNDQEIIGLFDSPYSRVGLSIPGIQSARTVFTVMEADVSGVAHGQTIRIGAMTYVIRGVEPDGSGTVRLVLQAP